MYTGLVPYCECQHLSREDVEADGCRRLMSARRSHNRHDVGRVILLQSVVLNIARCVEAHLRP